MTTLNINTLILSLSKIKNFGRKKIFKSISLIENLNSISLNKVYRGLKIDTKISETEWQDWQQSLPEIIYLLFFVH